MSLAVLFCLAALHPRGGAALSHRRGWAAIDLDDPTSGDVVVDWSHFAQAAAAMEQAQCPAPHPSQP